MPSCPLQTKNSELFNAMTLLVVLGTSMVTQLAGLSLALGALLVGCGGRLAAPGRGVGLVRGPLPGAALLLELRPPKLSAALAVCSRPACCWPRGSATCKP